MECSLIIPMECDQQLSLSLFHLFRTLGKFRKKISLENILFLNINVFQAIIFHSKSLNSSRYIMLTNISRLLCLFKIQRTFPFPLNSSFLLSKICVLLLSISYCTNHVCIFLYPYLVKQFHTRCCIFQLI